MTLRASALVAASTALLLTGCSERPLDVSAVQAEWQERLQTRTPVGAARSEVVRALQQLGIDAWQGEDGRLVARVAVNAGTDLLCSEWVTLATYTLDQSELVADVSLSSSRTCW